jgi:hypothetical protein
VLREEAVCDRRSLNDRVKLAGSHPSFGDGSPRSTRRHPRCELRAGRSLRSVELVKRVVRVVCGRCWMMGLLYPAAVQPQLIIGGHDLRPPNRSMR